MRRALALLLLTLPVSVVAQKNRPELTSAITDAVIALRDNPAKHGIQPYAMPDYKVSMPLPGEMSPMNANSNPVTRVIQISPDLVEVLKNDEGELAFVIAHEMGHLQDADCLAHPSAQAIKNQALKRTCESRADFIGLQYLMAAGFNPYDAAGALGKLLMFSPTEGTVTGILVNRFTSDHPVDIDRIQHLKNFINQICVNRPEICIQNMH